MCYKEKLAEVHLKLLLSEDANEAEGYRKLASLYKGKLEDLGQRYDPVRRRYEYIAAPTTV